MQKQHKKRILIIAGEASGDRHAADLVKTLKELIPGLIFTGIGGDEMKRQGVQLLYHIRQMAFLGFAEIIKHIPFVRRVFKELQHWIKKMNPLAVILIDYPGFNLRIAKMVKKLNIPVIYYICPQLWAWGEGRVEKMRKYVDLLLVIFEFEEKFYAQRGITAKFVGHPLTDQIQIRMSENEFRQKHHLEPCKPIIAILPGSRKNEISNLLPVVLETIEKFNDKDKYLWILGKANGISDDFYENIIGNRTNIQSVRHDIYPLLKFSHVAIVASGTATLETGYLGTPMIVIYKVSPLSYFIGKRVIKLQNIALANIVSGKKVVPELIQYKLTPENIIRELNKYLNDFRYYEQVKSELSKIPNKLGEPGAAIRAANEIARFLNL